MHWVYLTTTGKLKIHTRIKIIPRTLNTLPNFVFTPDYFIFCRQYLFKMHIKSNCWQSCTKPNLAVLQECDWYCTERNRFEAMRWRKRRPWPISTRHSWIWVLMYCLEIIHTKLNVIFISVLATQPGIFPRGTGGPPIWWKFCQSPHPTLVPVFGPRLVPPPPAEVRPRKFEKFKYIFVSNFTTFNLKLS